MGVVLKYISPSGKKVYGDPGTTAIAPAGSNINVPHSTETLRAGGFTNITTDSSGKVTGYTRPVPESQQMVTVSPPTKISAPTNIQSYTTTILPLSAEQRATRTRDLSRAQYSQVGQGVANYFSLRKPAKITATMPETIQDEYFTKEYTTYYGKINNQPQIVGREMRLVTPKGLVVSSSSAMLGAGGVIETKEVNRPISFMEEGLKFTAPKLSLANIGTAFTRAKVGTETKLIEAGLTDVRIESLSQRFASKLVPQDKTFNFKQGALFSKDFSFNPRSATAGVLSTTGKAIRGEAFPLLASYAGGVVTGFGFSAASPYVAPRIASLSLKFPRAMSFSSEGIKALSYASVGAGGLYGIATAPEGQRLSTGLLYGAKFGLFSTGYVKGQGMYEGALSLKNVWGTKYIEQAPYTAEEITRRGVPLFTQRTAKGRFEKVWGRQFIAKEVQQKYVTGKGGTPFPYDDPSTHTKYFQSWAGKAWRPPDVPSAKNVPQYFKGKIMGIHATTAKDLTQVTEAQLFVSGKGQSIRFARIGMKPEYSYGGETFVVKGSPKVFNIYAPKESLKSFKPLYEGKFVTSFSGGKPVKSYVFSPETLKKLSPGDLVVPGYKREVEAVIMPGTQTTKVGLEFMRKSYSTSFTGEYYPMIDKVLGVSKITTAQQLSKSGFSAVSSGTQAKFLRGVGVSTISPKVAKSLVSSEGLGSWRTYSITSTGSTSTFSSFNIPKGKTIQSTGKAIYPSTKPYGKTSYSRISIPNILSKQSYISSGSSINRSSIGSSIGGRSSGTSIGRSVLGSSIGGVSRPSSIATSGISPFNYRQSRYPTSINIFGTPSKPTGNLGKIKFKLSTGKGTPFKFAKFKPLYTPSVGGYTLNIKGKKPKGLELLAGIKTRPLTI